MDSVGRSVGRLQRDPHLFARQISVCSGMANLRRECVMDLRLEPHRAESNQTTLELVTSIQLFYNEEQQQQRGTR